MIQFYSPNIKESLQLGPEESIHCARVLRRKEGDIIFVTDGKGNRYKCRILDCGFKAIRFEIIGIEEIPKTWNHVITIAVAPTKNADRMAWLVEKCTEIGVDEILFLQCRHSERKTVNVERLRRNAISAMNQSLKTYLPSISDATPLDSILKRVGKKYFGYCDSTIQRVEFAKEYDLGNDITVAIGPEGDFTQEEVEKLIHAGYVAVTFGDERLRTETAAIYATAAIHVLEARLR